MTKPMKRLDFDGQSHFKRDSKERIAAVAWATIRRGRVSWKSENVNETVREYLAREAGYIMDPADVAYVLNWLVDNGYGWRKEDPNGNKRTVEFGINQDVDLTGHPKPKAGVTSRIARLRAEAEAVGMTVAPVQEPEGAANRLIGVNDMPMPGPEPPPPPVYRLDELAKLLSEWAEADHDAYARYVDTAIDRLT
jgi:hypothetical protein